VTLSSSCRDIKRPTHYWPEVMRRPAAASLSPTSRPHSPPPSPVVPSPAAPSPSPSVTPPPAKRTSRAANRRREVELLREGRKRENYKSLLSSAYPRSLRIQRLRLRRSRSCRHPLSSIRRVWCTFDRHSRA
jgi:hypothetical protein